MRGGSAAALCFAGLAAGCGPITPRSPPNGGYCAPPLSPEWTLDEDPFEPGDGRIERLASLLGLRADLRARRSASGAPPTADERLHALSRIEVARDALAAISAELACESERADQAADYLFRHQSDAVQELTIASVLVAAGTSVAGVILATAGAKNFPQDTVAIAGGGLTVGLGLGALYVHPKIDFGHPRNLLADVWNGPAVSKIYPPPVWAYLTRREFANDETRPIRERIVARWRAFETVDDDPGTLALLFGAGGRYDVDTLRTRASMLDQVRAEVDLGNQELALLAAELLR